MHQIELTEMEFDSSYIPIRDIAYYGGEKD